MNFALVWNPIQVSTFYHSSSSFSYSYPLLHFNSKLLLPNQKAYLLSTLFKMFNIYRYRTFLYHKTFTFSPSPNPLPFSLHFCTKTSDSTSFAVSYLIHNFGFSPHFASKLCSTYKVKFNTAQNPDSVLKFFRNNGFSNTQLRDMIAKAPELLSCNPYKRVLPKFQFLLSKGASNSDIVNIVIKRPQVLTVSLENKIVPTYELIYRFLQSDKDTITCAIHNPAVLSDHLVPNNIRILIENGVANSNIVRFLRERSRVLNTRDMLKLVEGLKDLGFNPSKTTFSVAFLAKIILNKTRWKEKVDVYKKWGWSDENVVKAFKRQPNCMIASIDKINLVMNFWVNQLGWDALVIAKKPAVLSSSFEKRLIPRASVVQYLMKKGLRRKNASLSSPFLMDEKLFIDRYIKRFEEESSYLLKLYEEKLNLAQTRDKTGMS